MKLNLAGKKYGFLTAIKPGLFRFPCYLQWILKKVPLRHAHCMHLFCA